MVLIATGSEVQLAMEAKKVLDEQGIPTRVVSIPCTNVFDRQDQAYKDSVLLPTVHKVAIEAGRDRRLVQVCWPARCRGRHEHFWRIRPCPELFKHFGFTVETSSIPQKT